jgi:transposase
MFFRKKKSSGYTYLQLVENRWEDGRSRQRVIATLGRWDKLEESGQLAKLLASGANLCESVCLLSTHARGELPLVGARRIGPALVFERLWQETRIKQVLLRLLGQRKYTFPVERAVFFTVLQRLFVSGSDRFGDKWRREYAIEGVEELDLHHLYRAMAWLGEELPEEQQRGRTPFAPRCVKDLVEEELFDARRDLFSDLDLVFFDTTSIYFEGAGGQELGRRGKSKDHRPDLAQMVVGAVLDREGRPILCELWPGNAADVKSLVPIVERLSARFGINRVCVVADRGMISAETLAELEERRWLYILGARMRARAEVRDEVLSRAGRYEVVVSKTKGKKAPSPLKVKEVWIWDRRYVVCLNEDQASKDAADREAIIQGLREQLKRGQKSLVGNKGYRKYLKKGGGEVFAVDEDKIREEARYDGKWVLKTNTDLPAAQVALKYKQLWMVEDIFRTAKALLNTRPIYHKRDETIRGHVFASFLALVLRKELEDRLEAKGLRFEWADILQDLDALQEVKVEQRGKRFVMRTEAKGTAGKVFQAIGAALPRTVQQVPAEEGNNADA